MEQLATTLRTQRGHVDQCTVSVYCVHITCCCITACLATVYDMYHKLFMFKRSSPSYHNTGANTNKLSFAIRLLVKERNTLMAFISKQREQSRMVSHTYQCAQYLHDMYQLSVHSTL